MSDTIDLATLTLQVSALPGLDPTGLRAWWRPTWRPPVEGECRAVGLTDAAVSILGDGQPPLEVPLEHAFIGADNAATRERLAQWLAEREGWDEPGALTWAATPRHDATGQPDGGHWSLYDSAGRALHYSGDGREGAAVSAIASVDVHDARLLPDGSRYADALALATVAWALGQVAP